MQHEFTPWREKGTVKPLSFRTAPMTSSTSGFIIRGTRFSAPQLPAGLYLVSTPIGNLGDITLRALETLSGCDSIACEDTRTSGVLLKRYGIDRPRFSYNEHNATERGPRIVAQLEQGRAVALISDAGTPLVSDPGFRLVQEVVSAGFDVFPIPGASAPLAALVGSGMSPDDFRFCGFLPHKAQAKRQQLEALKTARQTLIFFDGPSRIVDTLATIGETFGTDRPVVVARELTKMHETFHRGTAVSLAAEFEAMERVRGEIVIVIEGAPHEIHTETDVTDMLREALATMKTKDAANHVALQTGLAKQDLYKQALTLKND